MNGETNYRFRILSLDGGGIRGAFIASYLTQIEESLKIRLADYFDIIAGTSTGGIIAAGLAMHIPASQILAFYRNRGPEIFTRPKRPWPKGWSNWAKWAFCAPIRAPYCFAANRLLRRASVDHDWLWGSKYQSDSLRSAVDEVFKDAKIGEARTRLMIPSVDLTQGKPVIFKTPHLPLFTRDRHYRFADAVMSTTAAPTYFPHASIKPDSAYVDGGIWANNPSMCAVAEAIRIHQECSRDEDPKFNLQSIYLLSLGTGETPPPAHSPTKGAGIVWWAPKLFNLVSNTQALGIDVQTRYVLGNRYHRVDYKLPNGVWSLDSIDTLGQLIHFGDARFHETFGTIQPMFFTEKATPYTPFPDVAAPVQPAA